MIFKNENRKMLTQYGFITTTVLVSGLFIADILQFNKQDLGIAFILYCIYAILVCTFFDELHIKEDKFVSKCFYYEKEINLSDIKFIMYHKSRIVLHDQKDRGIHTFTNDNSERYHTILEKLCEADIPVKSYEFKFFNKN